MAPPRARPPRGARHRLDAAGLSLCVRGGDGGKRRVGEVRRLRIAWEIVRQLWPLVPAMAAWYLILGLLAAAEML